VTSGFLFLGTGIGLTVYFRYEKERLARKRIAEHTKGYGKPKVGGPFDLVDTEGRRFTHEDLMGKYALVSAFLSYSTLRQPPLGLWAWKTKPR
jgi:protein SCO1/2